MTTLHPVAAELRQVFPPSPFNGNAAAHDCLECDEIRHFLRGKSWTDVDEEHLLDIPLALLTPEGYRAFLPAWLWHGLRSPDSAPAVMALINMAESCHVTEFSGAERTLLVRCAEVMHASDPFAAEDHESFLRLQKIQENWRS